MRKTKINVELLQRYIEGKLSEEEEADFEMICLQNEEMFQEMQNSVKAHMLKSFTSQYSEIGKEVFTADKKGTLHFIFSQKINDVIEAGKETFQRFEQLIDSLIGNNAIPQIATLRAGEDENSKIVLELLEGGEDVMFKRDLDNMTFSLKYNSDKDEFIFIDVLLSDEPASKLLITDLNSTDVINEISVDTQSNGFSIPTTILLQNIGLSFQAK